jgi:hypothetical protein
MLDQLNATELLAISALLMERADRLPKRDPQKARLLQAASQLLERVRVTAGVRSPA